MAEPMSPKRRQESVMAGTRTAILAATRRDGRAHAVPACFVLGGDGILFLTNTGSVKGAGTVRQLRPRTASPAQPGEQPATAPYRRLTWP